MSINDQYFALFVSPLCVMIRRHWNVKDAMVTQQTEVNTRRVLALTSTLAADGGDTGAYVIIAEKSKPCIRNSGRRPHRAGSSFGRVSVPSSLHHSLLFHLLPLLSGPAGCAISAKLIKK